MSQSNNHQLRQAFGTYMTGVTVVTATSGRGDAVGFTANSFTSVSLDPPLVSICPAKTLTSFEVFNSCTHFAINILAEDQQDIANTFARQSDDRFQGLDWRKDKFGNAIFEGTSARFSCSSFNRIDAGDHIILLGQVEEFEVIGKPGLGFANGGYFSLGLERRAAELSQNKGAVNIGAIVEHDGKVLLEPSDDGWRLPRIAASSKKQSLGELQRKLEGMGVEYKYGPVYSIFQSTLSGEYSAFYRATARHGKPHAQGEYVKVEEIGNLKYSSKALSIMMRRYALERRDGVFRLYVGDDREGEVHMLAEGAEK